MNFLKLFSACVLLSAPLFSSGQVDCELRKDSDSIRVYTCKTGESKFKAIKAQFTVNALYSEAASMLLDIENYNTWQYKTVNARILKRIAEDELIYYAEVVAPWPISNRDIVIHAKMTQDPKTKWITLASYSIPDYIPVKDHIVRVPSSHSEWTLKVMEGSPIEAEYTLQIDPGGSLPAWVVNLFAAQGPYETFKAFRSMIHLHRKMNVSFIKD